MSLADILSLRDSGLNEQEAWAVCLECSLAMRSVAHSAIFQTLCITPDTLAFNTSGNVCFMEQLSGEARAATGAQRGLRGCGPAPGAVVWSRVSTATCLGLGGGRPGAGPHWWVVLAGPQVHVAPIWEEPGGLSHLTCVGGPHVNGIFSSLPR